MAFDFSPIRAQAIALIKEFGRPTPVKLLRAVNPTPEDTDKPWRVGPATIEIFEFTAVCLPIDNPNVDADLRVIVPGDVATLQSTGLTPITLGKPTRLDRILSNDVEYGIVGNIVELAPGADVIMWKLECKAWPLISSQPSTQS